MPIARPEPHDTRVIAHVDMDCFYVQVEQRKQPDLRGLPTAVVQYNSWKGGGLIAVSYEARKFGVTRSMRGDEAKKVCPDIQLVQVPVARGKADLNLYRNAGSEVVGILSTKGRCERASIDEVYLDLTDAAESMLFESPPELSEEIDEEVLKSHVLGVTGDEDNRVTNVREWLCRSGADHRDKLLACGAIIVARLRMKVLEETKFTCSAGIAHNKMLAKLASAMHKPAQQTVVLSSSVKDLLATLPVKKMKQLGGKLGSSLQVDLGVNTVGDLLKFSEEKLQELYGINTGSWLWNIARGISGEEVEGRLLPKSHGCGKTFPGPRALKTITSVEHWLNQLSEELSERIQSDFDQNKRVAHTLTLHARAYKANDTESQRKFPSKSCPLRYGIAKIQEDAKKLFDSALRDFLGPLNNAWRVTSLSVSASKLSEPPSGTSSILKFFPGKDFSSIPSNGSAEFVQDDLGSPSGSKSYMTENEDEQQKKVDVYCEATGKTNAMLHQDRTLKTSGKLDRETKDKGTSSILKFFPGKDFSSIPSNGSAEFVQDDLGSPSGSKSYMTEKDDEQQKKVGVYCEATGKTNAMLHQDRTLKTSGKLDRETKDKGTSSILKFFPGKDFSSIPSNGSTEFVQDDLGSPSGSKSYMTENEDEQQKKVDVYCEATGKTNAMLHQYRTLKTSGKLDRETKDKGTCTILRFFQGTNSHSANQACNGFIQDHVPSSAGSEGCSGLKPTEHRGEATLVDRSNEGHAHPQDQNVQRSERWVLNVEDIDLSVIDELPPEIQREVRGWLRPSKRPNVTKRKSSIAHYFSPAKS